MSKIVLQGNNAGTGTFTIQPPATNVNREFTLPDTGGTLAVTEQFHSPIGSLIWVTGTTAPGGYVVANGTLLDRVAYADLWAYAQASGNISVDDASWAFGQYSPGDGTTTFRVPKVEDNALTMLPCIKAYDVISDPNVLNAVGVVNEISRLESEKLRKDENINLGVSVAASGTAVDFVGIPEGVKRITVMFDGVSTNGVSPLTIRIGSGSVDSIGYKAVSCLAAGSSVGFNTSSSGFVLRQVLASMVTHGRIVIENPFESVYLASHILATLDGPRSLYGAGSKTLSGALDRLRITTENGTDLFDAGTINISWEF